MLNKIGPEFSESVTIGIRNALDKNKLGVTFRALLRSLTPRFRLELVDAGLRDLDLNPEHFAETSAPSNGPCLNNSYLCVLEST